MTGSVIRSPPYTEIMMALKNASVGANVTSFTLLSSGRWRKW